ncbi:hypothetical protein [Lacticaseibacillus thailandensis]|nr:hypothetical protein [Lacticaseibacillus thailandensis]
MKKRIKPSWLIGIAVVAVVVIVGVVMVMPKHLSGSYSAKVQILWSTSTDTLEFKGNKVHEKGTHNNGTYKIKGNKLDMTLDGDHKTATLSKDKKSFDLTAFGMKLHYTKDK